MLPERFDQNEIYVLVSLAALIFAVWILPKSVSRTAGITTGLFFSAVSCFADEVIGVTYPGNFYDTFDSHRHELFDIIMYFSVYILYGYIFINLLKMFLPRFSSKQFKIFYLLAWISASTILEGISDLFGVFHYLNGWNLFCSFLIYCLSFPLFFSFSKWVLKIEDSV
ncbi:hypothetical protein BpJC7_06850 [Weizmannia acidilactici]|uniref:Uncharacterized protein n=1 Tax=Weizmannia acidilactici TaxID=2607726 RepID=A0A5J4J2Y8_9BACI|nr:hypothetical protein [Weizmannia acidilactici]GER69382.1 hypothetical protein BpJC7_06850 [Weizmannia acidilactici]GER72291.1 hypothetical protein BpPP18_03580 [Weizmannia acidilactici]